MTDRYRAALIVVAALDAGLLTACHPIDPTYVPPVGTITLLEDHQ